MMPPARSAYVRTDLTELWLNHGVEKYRVALSCITADKSEKDVLQSTMVPDGAAQLNGGALMPMTP
jgi:hypothetical protein